ncbi:MAG: adenylate/guanylate cyclase domain-containing protein [Solirubrobacterales bacterium]|nr:adenylate/guanylate cyclase domain-containing protein [Solirubrobacterales bacterium]MBV9714367.1 adenylate/guanylate cyclase domain-containing protein [Solirubrobacterales bacterium]
MKPTRLFASNRQLKAFLLALVALSASAFGIVAYAADLMGSLEGSTIDTRFSVRGNQPAPKDVVLVKIDSRTFQDLNLQWPFPRAVDGRVISRIAAEHPAAIAFDVQLSEPSQLGQQDDVALLSDVNSYPNKMVFSDTEPDAHGDVAFLGSGQGTKLLQSVGAQPAEGSFPNESAGGVIRTMDDTISHLRTLAVVTAQTARHVRVEPFVGGRWIDFRGPAGTFPSLSFSEVYSGTESGRRRGTPLPRGFFRGKIVVVGATATNLQDIHATSTDNSMPGPEIQANAIDTVLRGFPLASVPGWIDIAVIVLLGIAVPVAALRVGPVVSIAIALGIGVLFAIIVQLAFNAGWVVAFVYPLAALVLSSVGSISVQLVTEAFERIRAVDLFARFVPENVVDEVLKCADGLRLGGVQREGTVMFTDLRGFTAFSESLTPHQVIEVLNHYLSEMSDAILDNGGTLVAYMGDGIFAVFGAPLEQSDHAERAVRAAREMLDRRLPRFNEWIRTEGLGKDFRMGIGLNSGPVMSGHVGSERRVEYAAVGDTTNTASRIEALTKGTPHQLLLSDSTRQALIEPPGDLVFVDEVEIRGRVARMKLWGLKEAGSATAAPAEAAQAPA